eukprot:1216135-Prymnesium_polylepis.1
MVRVAPRILGAAQVRRLQVQLVAVPAKRAVPLDHARHVDVQRNLNAIAVELFTKHANEATDGSLPQRAEMCESERHVRRRVRRREPLQ